MELETAVERVDRIFRYRLSARKHIVNLKSHPFLVEKDDTYRYAPEGLRPSGELFALLASHDSIFYKIRSMHRYTAARKPDVKDYPDELYRRKNIVLKYSERSIGLGTIMASTFAYFLPYTVANYVFGTGVTLVAAGGVPWLILRKDVKTLSSMDEETRKFLGSKEKYRVDNNNYILAVESFKNIDVKLFAKEMDDYSASIDALMEKLDRYSLVSEYYSDMTPIEDLSSRMACFSSDSSKIFAALRKGEKYLAKKPEVFTPESEYVYSELKKFISSPTTGQSKRSFYSDF